MEKVFLTVSPRIDAWSPSIYFFEASECSFNTSLSLISFTLIPSVPVAPSFLSSRPSLTN